LQPAAEINLDESLSIQQHTSYFTREIRAFHGWLANPAAAAVDTPCAARI
jgi:hypothetical protein